MLTTTHKFTSALEDGKFIQYDVWLEEKYGAEEAAKILATSGGAEPSAPYIAWIVDQKITHEVTDGNGTITVIDDTSILQPANTTKHEFKSELPDGKFQKYDKWLEEKYGAELAAEKLADSTQSTEPGSIYIAWLVDQKMTHTVTHEDGRTTSMNYKEI
jgi:hypothetical protein